MVASYLSWVEKEPIEDGNVSHGVIKNHAVELGGSHLSGHHSSLTI